MIFRTILLAGSFAVVGAVAPAAESFRQLSGPEIKRPFAGMEFTDKVHWALVFRRDGDLASFEMGAAGKGTWRVEKNELCLHPRTDLKVTLDGVEIKPGFALGSWLAFKPPPGMTAPSFPRVWPTAFQSGSATAALAIIVANKAVRVAMRIFLQGEGARGGQRGPKRPIRKATMFADYMDAFAKRSTGWSQRGPKRPIRKATMFADYMDAFAKRSTGWRG